MAGIALLAVFVMLERHAAEPVLPPWVLRRRILVTSSLVSAGVGAVLIGLTSYVPTFVQGVLGTGPLVAGFALATFTLGWPLSASQSGRAYMRLGFRTTALIGSAVAITGAILTALLGPGTSVYAVATTCFIVGLGMGWTAAPTLIAAQTTVGWSERGVVTAANMFSRSIGSTVAVAIFGAIANLALPDLAGASRHVFIAIAVVALLMGAAVVAMPPTPISNPAAR
jgi:MFS family permease